MTTDVAPGVTISGGPGSTQSAQKATYKVTSATGTELELQHPREKVFYEKARDKYLSDNTFSHASDLRAIDRLLLFEVQVFREQWMLASGVDYTGCPLSSAEEVGVRRSIKDAETAIANLQEQLGLTKVQRDKLLNTADAGQYIENLLVRAKAQGIKRDKEVAAAIDLLKETFSIAGTWKRSNEAERRKSGFEHAEDVVDWLLEVAKPMFDQIDEHYRTENQRNWIRTQ
jgi:hypothetical protein